MSVSITCKNIVKKFGENTIIPNLSVEVKNGEIFTLLGPSGCGKTTLLRMIAGFNSIEEGEVFFDNEEINDKPTHKRNIGMVFQSYAIFPHMTVRENIEYGLKLRKLTNQEIKYKVDEILEVVKITEYQNRLPEKLSGGQQQRVALARAIVIHPNVLLMDEPLSNLDAKLRIEMRSAIREIQKKVGITTIYVTHDQEEALAISDRIAIMNKGIIEQIGEPHVIYTRPSNKFVSTFIGYSNFFKGNIKLENKNKYVVFKNGYSLLMDNLLDTVNNGDEIIISVRPEEFRISKVGIMAKIKKSTFLGKYTNYEIEVNKEEIIENNSGIEFSQDIGQSEKIYLTGETIILEPNKDKINVFTNDGNFSLIKGVKSYEK